MHCVSAAGCGGCVVIFRRVCIGRSPAPSYDDRRVDLLGRNVRAEYSGGALQPLDTRERADVPAPYGTRQVTSAWTICAAGWWLSQVQNIAS